MRPGKLSCPSDLEVLLHCHYSGEVHPRIDAPAVSEGLMRLLNASMIEPDTEHPRQFNTTGRGKWFIQHLLSIPFPVEVTTYAIPVDPA